MSLPCVVGEAVNKPVPETRGPFIPNAQFGLQRMTFTYLMLPRLKGENSMESVESASLVRAAGTRLSEYQSQPDFPLATTAYLCV